MEQRLQKLLAAAGVASRRSCEALIAAGRVTVDGECVTTLGTKADPDHADIRIDGRPLQLALPRWYVLLNKPTGYVTTVSDPHAKHTVMELVRGIKERIYPVGRLDVDTAGLLLLTNDGDFAERLSHPSHGIPKTYRVVARGEVPEWAGADLRKGILLEDGMTAPAETEWVDYDRGNNASIIDVTIHEGRNRQVRRMFAAIGYPVLALTRIRIGPIELKGIAPGAWRRLRPAEVQALLAEPSTSPAVVEPAAAEIAAHVDGHTEVQDAPSSDRSPVKRRPKRGKSSGAGMPPAPRTDSRQKRAEVDSANEAVLAAAQALNDRLKADKETTATPRTPGMRSQRRPGSRQNRRS